MRAARAAASAAAASDGAAGGVGGFGCGRRRGWRRLRRSARSDLGEAVALLQAEGGGGGGGAGGDGEAVPAPEVALAADEALAGGERGLQARAVGAVDDGDGGEAAGERGRGR